MTPERLPEIVMAETSGDGTFAVVRLQRERRANGDIVCVDRKILADGLTESEAAAKVASV